MEWELEPINVVWPHLREDVDSGSIKVADLQRSIREAGGMIEDVPSGTGS